MNRAGPGPQSAGPLARTLLGLRSKDSVERAKAASILRELVENEGRELSRETYAKFMEELNRRIQDLVSSDQTHEKLGGIAAIDALIDVSSEDDDYKIIRFANYLRGFFSSASPETVTLERASKALGHLARAGGTLTADFVEFEVKRALEWLEGKVRSSQVGIGWGGVGWGGQRCQCRSRKSYPTKLTTSITSINQRIEVRRHAAVLVLKEMAENAPTLFYVHVARFFENIWVALRDPSVEIRESATRALSACLSLISKRESRWRVQWYYKIFEMARAGLRAATRESIHGALLTLGELLHHSGRFMLPRFGEVCDAVLRYRDHRDRLVRRTVIALIPRLANYAPDAFVRGYLGTCLAHLIQSLKHTSKRATAFIAMGKMSLAVKHHIVPKLGDIAELIRDGLTPRRRKPFCHEALACISMLAKAVGPALTDYVAALLEQMFSAGLNGPLIDALSQVGVHIPLLLPHIQERLVQELSFILSGGPYSPFGHAIPLLGGNGEPLGDIVSAGTAAAAWGGFGNLVGGGGAGGRDGGGSDGSGVGGAMLGAPLLSGVAGPVAGIPNAVPVSPLFLSLSFSFFLSLLRLHLHLRLLALAGITNAWMILSSHSFKHNQGPRSHERELGLRGLRGAHTGMPGSARRGYKEQSRSSSVSSLFGNLVRRLSLCLSVSLFL